MFPPDWLEIGCLPYRWSRQLGECFAVFIWGQWRVAVKGPERSAAVIATQNLREAWPWSPPIALLGKSCLCFLQENDRSSMEHLLEAPLRHDKIIEYAPIFAAAAEKCLVDIERGVFTKGGHNNLRQGDSTHVTYRSATSSQILMGDASHDTENFASSDNDMPSSARKVKFEALRSYTFDLVDGPILGLNLWNDKDPKTKAKTTKKEKSILPRDKMLLYMERMKLGLDVIKVTFGPEWMYIWLMNEYGRALNARMHLEQILKQQVEIKAERAPVVHMPGRFYLEPSTQPIPLLAFGSNLLRGSQDIFGSTEIFGGFGGLRPSGQHSPSNPRRQRSRTCPNIFAHDYNTSDEEDGLLGDIRPVSPQFGHELSPLPEINERIIGNTANNSIGVLFSPMIPPPPLDSTPSGCLSRKSSASRKSRSLTDSDLLYHPDSEGDLITNLKSTTTTETLLTPPPNYRRSKVAFSTPKTHPGTPEMATSARRTISTQTSKATAGGGSGTSGSSTSSRTNGNVMSILDCLLCQQDENGNGMSQAVTTDVAIMLWMMMDVGNAWTSMALKLISLDEEACELVLDEMDYLISRFGADGLLSKEALGSMNYLDALLYEAIRLCPPFLGGLKVTSETVVLDDDGIQIPKDSHVFFCQPTDRVFDIQRALGKRPEDLGRAYPSIELFGFLPFHGLEVPLMVLQSKVFLAVLLKDHSPVAPRKKKLFRRVRAVSQRIKTEVLKKSPQKQQRKLGPSQTPSSSSDYNMEDARAHSCGDAPPEIPASLIDCVLGCGDSADEPNSLDEEEQQMFRSLSITQSLPSAAAKVTPTEAMQWFTKIPFPEPRSTVQLKRRTHSESD